MNKIIRWIFKKLKKQILFYDGEYFFLIKKCRCGIKIYAEYPVEGFLVEKDGLYHHSLTCCTCGLTVELKI